MRVILIYAYTLVHKLSRLDVETIKHYTLPANYRFKGVLMIFCVCESVYWITNTVESLNELFANVKLYKEQK